MVSLITCVLFSTWLSLFPLYFADTWGNSEASLRVTGEDQEASGSSELSLAENR